MLRPRTPGRLAIALLLVATTAVVADRWLLSPWLLRVARLRLRERLAAPAEVATARYRPPWSVELSGVSTAAGSAERVRLQLDPTALVRGRVRVVRASASGLTLGGQATARSAAAVADGEGGEQLTLSQVSHRRWPLTADRVTARLDAAHRPGRIELAGGRWGGLGGIAADATRRGEQWEAQVTWPGLAGTARLTAERLLVAEVAATEAPLPARPAPGIELGAARLSGSLHAAGSLEQGSATVDLSLRGLWLALPALAEAPLGPLSVALQGPLRIDGRGRTVESDGLELRSGAVAVRLSGRIAPAGDSVLEVALEPTPCQALLEALRPLLPHLEGLELAGSISARLRASAAAGRFADLVLDPEVEVGCQVGRDAAAADPGRLELLGASAAAAGAPLRSLESLGRPLLRALLVGEDARFFRHRGFDPWTIRRALAADLEAGAFVRGASTITQQLARNLFLDGQRTLSRKLEEAVIAWRLEQTASKREILEAWLRLIELGPEVRGVEAGARYWFGKDPAALDEREAAALAALAPAPSRGFDLGWSRRYRDLEARLPLARVELPPPPARPARRR